MKVFTAHTAISTYIKSAMQSICPLYAMRNFKQQHVYVQKSTFINFRK
jgi:hypothetical protein